MADPIVNWGALGRKLKAAFTVQRKQGLQGDWRFIQSFPPAVVGLLIASSTNAFVKQWVVNVCCRNIGDLVASLPKSLEDRQRAEIDPYDNRIAQLILIKPNEIEKTAWRLWNRLAIDEMLWGNSYVHVLGPENPAIRPLSLTPLFARHITPRMKGAQSANTETWNMSELEYFDESNPRNEPFSSTEIIHSLEYNPDSRIKGLSWLAAGRKKIDRADNQETFNTQIYENGVYPSMNFSTDQELFEPQRTALRQEIEKNFAGALKAGGFLLTDKGVSAKPLAISPKDLEVIENEKVTAGNIASMLNYPPELLGTVFVTKNVATYREARKQLYQQAVIPLAKRFIESFNSYFFPRGDYRFKINTSSIAVLQPTTEELSGAWWMSPNQRRTAQGLSAIDDPLMDKIYIPSGFQPIDQVGFQGSEEEL
jgi:HK97 family phage portal protein